MKRAGGLNGRKMSFHTVSRWSQPPFRRAVASERRLMAHSVPLSRFTSRVGGGSAFYVRWPDSYEIRRPTERSPSVHLPALRCLCSATMVVQRSEHGCRCDSEPRIKSPCVEPLHPLQ